MSLSTDIKIMYLNPVGSSSDDSLFADMAREYKYPGTSVDIASLNPATAPPRSTNLEFRSYEALIVAGIVHAARQASREGYDAMAIGYSNSRMWGMEPPPEDELGKFGIYRDDDQFGNRIHVPADGADPA